MTDPQLSARLRTDAAVRVGAMLWGGLACVDLMRGVGASPQVSLAALTLLAAACSWHVSRLAGVLVAGTGWLVVTGFVVNSYGELTWHGPADLFRLGLLLIAAWVGGAGR